MKNIGLIFWIVFFLFFGLIKFGMGLFIFYNTISLLIIKDNGLGHILEQSMGDILFGVIFLGIALFIYSKYYYSK